jgi:PAS domain S-box-containing protein
MIDADGRYWMVSDSTAQALGRPKSEIIGRGFDELLPPAVAAEFRWSIAAVIDSGEQHIKTDTMPGPDGDPRSYQTTLFPARIVDGTVTMVGVLSVDITERVRSEQRARENEQRWQYAVDNAGDGLWDWDARTDRVFYSSRWKSMLGYAESEIGDGLDEWESRIHPDDYTDTFQKLQRHLRGESAEYRHEHRLRCKDGGYKWILDRGKVVERDEDGKPLRVIGTHTDIDRRKRLEEELRRGRTT